MNGRVIVTTDLSLSDEATDHIKRIIDGWLAHDIPRLIVADPAVHLAVEQPDGTWVRVCHEHAEAHDPNEPPLIDGCRVVHRGDGFDVCKVHNRYWKTGTQMCPSKSEAAWVRVYEATHP